ncbi:MAG: glycosyltransferase [Reyranella sp.]|uniref:glycosyltransferase family 2 protein n=1 Tax=Reyranella sp. TaxID=1929291 RepID=UPI0025CC1670|nr:glycosyltransferase [Reyranella sp.]MBR2818247.1 glycosyltransferase [Reyranella sp.]
MPESSQTTRPTVSVVIPTLNREAMLCRTIETLLGRETYSPYELIVVDQTEQHEEATNRYLESVRSRIVHRRVTYKSLPRARNEGLALAKGDIVVFVDDDVEVEKGFLAAHVAPYADPEVWAVTGPAPAPGEALKSRTDITDAEYALLLTDDRPLLNVDFDFSPCSWGVGCNLSVRRAEALRVGGFDEHFVANAVGEDAEFCYRLRKGGGTIYYAGGAALVHFQDPSGGSRTDVGADYVRTLAYNVNYFCRAIDRGLADTIRINWRNYRRFVLNRHALGRLGTLHASYLRGLYRGRRQPRWKSGASAGDA